VRPQNLKGAEWYKDSAQNFLVKHTFRSFLLIDIQRVTTVFMGYFCPLHFALDVTVRTFQKDLISTDRSTVYSAKQTIDIGDFSRQNRLQIHFHTCPAN